MHTLSPTFAALERKLRRHVRAFARALEFDLEGRELAMTDCWINIMPRLVVHSLHLHPLSTISGTYYVQTPRGAPGIKFEDPRLDRFMAAPPRKPDCRPEQQAWVTRARVRRQAGAVRELAAPRGAAEPGRGRAHQHQFQLRLVLSGRLRPGSVDPAARANPGVAPPRNGRQPRRHP